MQFRNDIQGLRAVAFLLVFIFHLNKDWFPGGFLGVDLFFVISGFLISSITYNDIEKKRFTFKHFFLKRITRIIPAYFFMIMATLCLGVYTYIYTDMPYLRDSAMSAAFFYSNLYFQKGDNYFGAGANENPFLHTWSLAIEMQFYLILPFVIYFFRKYLRWVYLFIIFLLTLYTEYKIQVWDYKPYFALSGRIPEFLIGSLFGITYKHSFSLTDFFKNCLGAISMAFIMCAALTFSEDTALPGANALLFCIAVSTILVLEKSFVNRILRSPVFVYVGKLSYSLYLWHFPVLAYLRYHYDSYYLAPLQMMFAILLIIALSLFSYYFVENYLVKLGERKKIISICAGLSAIILFCYILPSITAFKKLPAEFTGPVVGTESFNTGRSVKLGDIKADDGIILLGDSHAAALNPCLDYIGKKNNFSFRTLSSAGIMALEKIDKKELIGTEINHYNNSRKSVKEANRLLAENKILIINSANFALHPSISNAVEDIAKNLKPDQSLVLIKTFPILDKNPIKLNNSIRRKNHTVIHQKTVEESNKFIDGMTSKYPHVYSYNIFMKDLFNNPGYINDTVSYNDKGHINNYAAVKLGRKINADFAKFLNTVKNDHR